jgi:hypothetical protein
VRHPKETHGMKAHVVQQVEEKLLHIHSDFLLSGGHGLGVSCSPSGSSVSAIIVKMISFYQHDVGRPLAVLGGGVRQI